MTENGSQYNLDITDDKEAIHLLINLTCMVIVSDPGSPNINTPHSNILFSCGTNVRDSQYKI